MRQALLLLALFAVPALVAADPPSDVGFRPLFNGRDLTGWTYKNQPLDGKTETPDKRFQVIDGAIATPGGGGNLYTVASFDREFHLKMEIRAAAKADSGVFVRGPQLQVRDFIRRKEHMQLEKVFKNDDWNELDITVKGQQIVTTVNGQALGTMVVLELRVKDGKGVARVDGKDVDITNIQVQKVAATVCKLNGIAFDPSYRAGPKGPIGLQAETGKFEFRNVRIKESP